ncbi:MAG: hypothetical protein ACOYOZ_11330, partial [Pirellula sp.]
MVHRMKSEGLESQWCGGMMVHRTRSNCVLPKRGGGIAGSLNEARWLYAPTVLSPNGAQGDSPGQSQAPPWDSVRDNFREPCKGERMVNPIHSVHQIVFR